MTHKKYTIIGLGELLWDLFACGKQLGGAPANFAYITNLLGDEGIPASRVGDDALGDEALARLAQLGVSAAFVQTDPDHPTGAVKVEIGDGGQPRFEILEPVAWDFMEWAADWQQLASQADAVCFGSLAQRSALSRTTIRSFLHTTRREAVRVFDVNLRQNFYSKEVLEESMKLATIVKLNHEELPRIMRIFEFENCGEQESARRLLSLHNLKLVCITRGNRGSLLKSSDEDNEHPGFEVKIADTVGAGDAFTAALVHGYLRKTPLAQINDTANRVGAWVASQSGATPAPKPEGLKQTLAEIV
ncbi:MAG: carbohydrate kinase [Candidatus Sulfotelmatobacter sp.]